jgi:hypothetical protein
VTTPDEPSVTEREVLRQLAPGQGVILPAQDGARHRAQRRIASVARALWGNGAFRTVSVADGIHVLRLDGAPGPSHPG